MRPLHGLQNQAAFLLDTLTGHFALTGERDMKIIGRWFSRSGRRGIGDADPYLESLVRELLLLKSGQVPRRSVLAGTARY